MRGVGANLHVEMEIDDLAEFMFIRNKTNAIIDLSLGGIQSNKDFFYFCLDLFCKGLVILFGNGSNSVNIDDLTLENYGVIREKMICAGIDSKLQTFPVDISNVEETNAINFDDLSACNDNLPLTSYEFKICSPQLTYVLSFNTVHHHTLQQLR